MKNFSNNNYSKKSNDKDNKRSRSKNNYKSNNFQEDRFNFIKNNTYERNNFKKGNDLKIREESNRRDNYKRRDDFKSRDDSNKRDSFKRRDDIKFKEDSNRRDNYKGRDNFNRRDDFKRNENIKTNEYIYLKPKEKSRNSFNQPQTRSSSKAYKAENYSENSSNKFQLTSNERNFEDWIWGKHSVFAALKSERPINRIWCTAEIFSSEKFYLLLKDLKTQGVLIEEVTWSRLSQLTSGAVHQGVALQHASTKSISLEKLIDISKSKSSNPIIVALDGVTDPHNFGAIIRSAEAFDCKGIIVPQRRSAGLTGTVAKVAAGALEHIPVSRVVNLNRAIDVLKKKGFIIIGLSGEGQVPISQFKEKAPYLVIVGSENKGISLLVQKKCDYLLKIPLKGKTSSLNASVAAAISLCYITNN